MSCVIKKKEEDDIIPLYRNLFNKDNGVHELTLKDFYVDKKKLYLKNKNFVKNKGFVLFYAPWCSHCKKFKSDYENLALDYIQLYPFGAVNTENVKDENDKLRVFADVDKIPKLKVINKDGYLENFDSNLSYNDLLYYLNMNI
jgi:thiol-disulfide isomerase/thioredoxin